MFELISSPESNSFISHSFVEFVELSLSPDLCRIDMFVDEWFALSRIFVFVPLGRRFSTERQVDLPGSAFDGNRNRKLLISRAPTKAKSQEPAYSQALNQNKIDRQGSRSRES